MKKGFSAITFKMNYYFCLGFSSNVTCCKISVSKTQRCFVPQKTGIKATTFLVSQQVSVNTQFVLRLAKLQRPLLASSQAKQRTEKERKGSLLAWKEKVFSSKLTKEAYDYYSVLGEKRVICRDSHKNRSMTASSLWEEPKYSLFLTERLLKPTLRGTKQLTRALPPKVEAQATANAYQKNGKNGIFSLPQRVSGGSFPKVDKEAYPLGKTIFFNQCFDKGRLKNFVLWFLLNYGENKTVSLVEQLKNIGFQYASKAGISLGIDDLKIPPKKADLIYEAEKQIAETVNQYVRGEITGVERFQRLIDTWHRTSEVLKQEVINYFEATDILNPVYMMAFSGARGNISQVRQLVGMRGLMADPQGQIIDFPIRSNFREGLTLTEYLISSYGARKGIVDTALRTANAGYLTRRLVDVAQHVIISKFDCGTRRGIFLTNMKEGNKTIHSLAQRTVGRILARDLFLESKTGLSWQSTPSDKVKSQPLRRGEEALSDTSKKPRLGIPSLWQGAQPKSGEGRSSHMPLFRPGEGSSVFALSKNKRQSLIVPPLSSSLGVGLASSAKQPLPKGVLRPGKDFPTGKRNEEITLDLSFEIGKSPKMQTSGKIFVRSPLTCETSKLICQLCYGWSLGQGNLVSIGEAVGVVAAQSIGEPGTQLTMRTFHTGGVFSGDVSDQIKAPFDGILEYLSAIPGTLIRTPEGQIAFLTKSEGSFIIKKKTESSVGKRLDETCVPVSSDLSSREAQADKAFPALSSSREHSLLASHEQAKGRLKSSQNKTLADLQKEEKRKYKIPTYTLLYVRNGQNVFEKQVVAQISSISRKSHATDDAQLTIYSEMEGQFYSKSLGFIALHDQFLSPRIPPSTKELFSGSCVASKLSRDAIASLPSLRAGKETPQTPRVSGPEAKTPFDKSRLDPNLNELEVEKIYEAWMWGYAWILSGKVFNFKYASPFFVQLGDFLNKKSYINKITWKLNLNNGNQMHYESGLFSNKDRNFSNSSSSPIAKSVEKKVNGAASWASSFFRGKKTGQDLLTFSSKKRQLISDSSLEKFSGLIFQENETSAWNLIKKNQPSGLVAPFRAERGALFEKQEKLSSIGGSLTGTSLPVVENSLPYDLTRFLRTGKAIISKQIQKEPSTLKKLHFNQSSNVFFFDLNQIIYKKSAYGLELTNKIGFLSYLPKQKIASQTNMLSGRSVQSKGWPSLSDPLLALRAERGNETSGLASLEGSSTLSGKGGSDFIILLNSLSGPLQNNKNRKGTPSSFILPEKLRRSFLSSPKRVSLSQGQKQSNFLKGTSQRLGHKCIDFLQWFPSQYQTLTGGIAFFEKRFLYDIPRRSVSYSISLPNKDSLMVDFTTESAQFKDRTIQDGCFDSFPVKDKLDLFLKKQLNSKTHIESQRILWLQSNFWKIYGLPQSALEESPISGLKGPVLFPRTVGRGAPLAYHQRPAVPTRREAGSFSKRGLVTTLPVNSKSHLENGSAHAGPRFAQEPAGSCAKRGPASLLSLRAESSAFLGPTLKTEGSLLVFAFLNKNESLCSFPSEASSFFHSPLYSKRGQGQASILIKKFKQMNRQGQVQKFALSRRAANAVPSRFFPSLLGERAGDRKETKQQSLNPMREGTFIKMKVSRADMSPQLVEQIPIDSRFGKPEINNPSVSFGEEKLFFQRTQPLPPERGSSSEATPLVEKGGREGRESIAALVGSEKTTGESANPSPSIVTNKLSTTDFPLFDPFIIDLCLYLCKSLSKGKGKNFADLGDLQPKSPLLRPKVSRLKLTTYCKLKKTSFSLFPSALSPSSLPLGAARDPLGRSEQSRVGTDRFFIAKSANFIEKFFNKLILVKNFKTFEKFINSRCLRFGVFGDLGFVDWRSDSRSLPVIFGKGGLTSGGEMTASGSLWVQAKQEVEETGAYILGSDDSITSFSKPNTLHTRIEPLPFTFAKAKAAYSSLEGADLKTADLYKSIDGFILDHLQHSYGLSKKGWIIIPFNSFQNSTFEPKDKKLGASVCALSSSSRKAQGSQNYYDFDKKLIYPGQKGLPASAKQRDGKKLSLFSKSNPFFVPSLARAKQEESPLFEQGGPGKRGCFSLSEQGEFHEFYSLNQISFHTPVFTECILLTDVFRIDGIKQITSLFQASSAFSSRGVHEAEFPVLSSRRNQPARFAPAGPEEPAGSCALFEQRGPDLWQLPSGDYSKREQELTVPMTGSEEACSLEEKRGPSQSQLKWVKNKKNRYPLGKPYSPSQREVSDPFALQKSIKNVEKSASLQASLNKLPAHSSHLFAQEVESFERPRCSLSEQRAPENFRIGLLIQPIEEYTPNTNNNFKKYVSEYTKNVLKRFKKPISLPFSSPFGLCARREAAFALPGKARRGLASLSKRRLLEERAGKQQCPSLSLGKAPLRVRAGSLLPYESRFLEESALFSSSEGQSNFFQISKKYRSMVREQSGISVYVNQSYMASRKTSLVPVGPMPLFAQTRQPEMTSIPTSRDPLFSILVNHSFDSLFNWKVFRNSLYNKQENLFLCKYMQQDFDVFSLHLAKKPSAFSAISSIISSNRFSQGQGAGLVLSDRSNESLEVSTDLNTFEYIVSRKPLNLSSFLISWKTNWGKSLAFKNMSYRMASVPISQLDNSLYASFSKKMSLMLSFYLYKSSHKLDFPAFPSLTFKGLRTGQRTMQEIVEDSKGILNQPKASPLPSSNGTEQRMYLHSLLSVKSTFYYHINSLINRIMESPCFSFNLIYELNMVGLFHNNFIGQVFFPFGQKADIFDKILRFATARRESRDTNKSNKRLPCSTREREKDVPPFFPSVTKQGKITKRGFFTSNSASLLNKASFQKVGKLPQKTKYLYSFTNDFKSTRYFAETNYYSPFVGEIIYSSTQRNMGCKASRFALEERGSEAAFLRDNLVRGVEEQQKEVLPITTFGYNCMFLTQVDLVSYYFTKEDSLIMDLKRKKESTRFIPIRPLLVPSKESLLEKASLPFDEQGAKHNYEISNAWTTSINFLKITKNEFVLENFQRSNSSFFRATKSKSLNQPVEASKSLSQIQKLAMLQKEGKFDNMNFDTFIMDQKAGAASLRADSLTKRFIEKSSTKPDTSTPTQESKQPMLELPRKEVFLNLKISKLKAGIPSIFCGFSLLAKQPSGLTRAFLSPALSVPKPFRVRKVKKGFQKLGISETLIKRGKVSSLLGDFIVYGDQISFTDLREKSLPARSEGEASKAPALSSSSRKALGRSDTLPLKAVKTSGQIIHYNRDKITVRRGQAIFISPKGILHKFDGDFIDAKTPVITLSYERLKTGDIIQGIPKVEQFFEARTTKRGRIFRDSLPALLKGLFNRYKSKYPLDLAVRQSFYKIQQIIVDGVQRVYKAQGVTIADKHLEVIVKQMTSKVRIIDGAQTGFFPGEVVDLFFVEKVNGFLIKKITYEPLVLGITKASLEVDSFLSASSFQQTTRILSQAAIYRKKDFLKGLKENVILGNLIPAGTGYLVYLNDVSPLNEASFPSQ